jgi:hypothetical protein
MSARREILQALGAEGAVVDELLVANRCRLDAGRLPGIRKLPLTDEPHVSAWRSYARSAEAGGAWTVLRDRLVQLQFPIRKGISQDDAYRAATLRGELAAGDTQREDLRLRQPAGLRLVIHPTSAGALPVLDVMDREDFESLVRVFTARNEPARIPASMGACLVSGYNNWDRIWAHRSRWEAEDPNRRGDAAAWSEEFRRLREDKALYQDRFVLLSRGPYSDVAAPDAGMTEEEWLERSFVIRREHECTHYFTLRVFGILQHNLLEELVADFVGLVRTFGTYRRDLALRFLGLESFPEFREGGRLGNYCGDPPLSAAAFTVLIRLAEAAVRNLARMSAEWPQCGASDVMLDRLAAALVCGTLEELASDDAPQWLAARLRDLSSNGAKEHGSVA